MATDDDIDRLLEIIFYQLDKEQAKQLLAV